MHVCEMFNLAPAPNPIFSKSPFVTSGIRLGTPAITTRGAKEDDMIVIADAIKAAVIDKDNDKAMALVKSITDKYPLYA